MVPVPFQLRGLVSAVMSLRIAKIRNNLDLQLHAAIFIRIFALWSASTKSSPLAAALRGMCVSLRTFACAVGGRGAGAEGRQPRSLRSREKRQGGDGQAFCCLYGTSPAASGVNSVKRMLASLKEMAIFAMSLGD